MSEPAFHQDWTRAPKQTGNERVDNTGFHQRRLSSPLLSERYLGEVEDGLKHGLGKLTGKGILLAGMIGADQALPIGQTNRNPMAESWSRLRDHAAVFLISR